MKVMPYLTFAGQCAGALELYGRAFKTKAESVMKASDIPAGEGFVPPSGTEDMIVQAVLPLGDGLIRMSDSFGQPINEAKTDRLCVAVEADEETIRNAFAVLAEKGRVGMDLTATFYSACTGIVDDKFGVKWNLMASAG